MILLPECSVGIILLVEGVVVFPVGDGAGPGPGLGDEPCVVVVISA